MTSIGRSEASLRFFGADLAPDDVSHALGASPTHADIRGQPVTYPPNSKRIAKRGSWRLRAATRNPEDLDAQIAELFSQLTDDLDVWRRLTSAYHADLFCGLFLTSSNDGLTLSAESMRTLSDRGVKLGLDIYECDDDDNRAQS